MIVGDSQIFTKRIATIEHNDLTLCKVEDRRKLPNQKQTIHHLLKLLPTTNLLL